MLNSVEHEKSFITSGPGVGGGDEERKKTDFETIHSGFLVEWVWGLGEGMGKEKKTCF